MSSASRFGAVQPVLLVDILPANLVPDRRTVAEKYGVLGGGGGVLPVCGEVAGTGGRQRQPVAAGVPQTMFAPSCCCVTGSRNGLLANSVLGRLAEGLTTQLIQFEVLPACAQLPWT